MAEKIVIAEFDLDMEAAIKETIRLKEENVKLRATLKDVKESQGELSSEYIQGSAALKANQAAIRTQEQLLIKATAATNSQAGSIDQLRAQLSIVSKQWSALSEAERTESETGKELAAQKLALTEALKAEEKATGDNARNVGNYEQAIIPLKAQLKEIVQQMQLLAVAGKDDGQEFIDLAEKAGKIKDAMNATNDQMKVFAVGNNFEQGLKIAKGSFDALNGAAQTYEGTLAALGVQNEDAAKVIQKLVALQSIQNGVTQVFDSLQKESAFMLGLNTAATKAAAAGQAIYATAVGTSTGAMKAFRIALLATGIGAIVVAIGLLAANWDKLSNIMAGNSQAAKKLNLDLKILEETQKANIEANELDIKIMEASGVKDSQVSSQKIKNNEALINSIEDQRTKIMALEMLDKATDEQKETRKKALGEIQKLLDENLLLGIQRRKQAAQEEIAIDEMNLKGIKSKQIAIESFELVSNRVYATQLNNILTNYKEETAINNKKYAKGLIDETQYQSNIIDIEKTRRDAVKDLDKQTASENITALKNKLEAYKTNSTELITTDKLLNDEFVTNQRDRNDKIYNDEKDILDKSLKAKFISQSDYIAQVAALDKSWKDNDNEITAQVATAHVEALNLELEKYIAANAEKVNSYSTTEAELNRLAAEQAKIEFDIKTKSLNEQLASNQISQTEYDNQYLVAKTALNKSIADLDEQERLRKINNLKTDYDNQLAIAQDSIFKQLDIQRQQNELKKQEELAAAEKTGASRVLIEQKYSKAAITISRAERDAKLNLYSQFSQNIATIAGENTKIGKAAAVAATTINTYQSATAAYTGMVETIEGPWGIVAGIAAAAASVVMGLANVRKILSVQPGSTPSSGGGEGSTAAMPQLTSTLQSANTDIGAGIVSRNTDPGQAGTGAKTQNVLVVDNVTNAQKVESSKVNTATI